MGRFCAGLDPWVARFAASLREDVAWFWATGSTGLAHFCASVHVVGALVGACRVLGVVLLLAPWVLGVAHSCASGLDLRCRRLGW